MLSQKFYKLKNESAKLAGGGASAPSTPLKPRPGSNKITKSPASARARKSKATSEILTADIFKREEEQTPTLLPSIKANADIPCYKVHQETPVKREDAKVKVEGDMENIS